MHIAYTPFVPADLEAFETMVLALYDEDRGGEPMSRAKARRTARHLAQHPDRGGIHLFRADGGIVGYGVVLGYWSNEYGGLLGVIDELYVCPQWRGRGIAGGFIEQLAVSGAFCGLTLEVTPTNDLALAYYQRLGFRLGANRHLFRRMPKA